MVGAQRVAQKVFAVLPVGASGIEISGMGFPLLLGTARGFLIPSLRCPTGPPVEEDESYPGDSFSLEGSSARTSSR